MPDETVIRKVKPADIEALMEIAAAAWAPVFDCWRGILGDEIFDEVFSDWKPIKRSQVKRACDPADPAIVLVAERAEQVVGFVAFYANPQKRIGEISINAVHPDHQGHGIGAVMYERAFEQMRTRGMRIVKVFTGADPAHTPARRAYEKVGFSVSLPSVEYYRKL